MDYQVYQPSAELQPFIKCFWTLEDGRQAIPVRQRVLPDGCMEMLFHYGDHFRQFFEDGTSIIQPKCFVFGQITTGFIEIAPEGVTGIISARFNPDGLQPFLDIPVAALENKATPLADLFGEKGKLLEQQVLEADDTAERIRLIETFLLEGLSTQHAADTVIKSCLEVILQSQGQVGVVELADQLNTNRRKIERRFTSAIGMSPKQLARVVRLQATLKMLEEQKFTSLTSLAYENGYYDQAHFIRDFKEFTGMSPKSFFAGNLKLATLFTKEE